MLCTPAPNFNVENTLEIDIVVFGYFVRSQGVPLLTTNIELEGEGGRANELCKVFGYFVHVRSGGRVIHSYCIKTI